MRFRVAGRRQCRAVSRRLPASVPGTRSSISRPPPSAPAAPESQPHAEHLAVCRQFCRLLVDKCSAPTYGHNSLAPSLAAWGRLSDGYSSREGCAMRTLVVGVLAVSLLLAAGTPNAQACGGCWGCRGNCAACQSCNSAPWQQVSCRCGANWGCCNPCRQCCNPCRCYTSYDECRECVPECYAPRAAIEVNGLSTRVTTLEQEVLKLKSKVEQLEKKFPEIVGPTQVNG